MTDPVAPATNDAHLLAAAITRPVGASGWTPPSPQELTGLPNLEVIALIGCGGMAAVYCARQTHLDRHVALKILSPERSADPAFVERFEREARALARLNHPHIVVLHDFGRSGPWLYLVLELVEGATLRQVMQTGNLSADESLRLGSQLCDALAHAHGAGVVHRDLKPENILIDGRGRAKIADFGLAKLREVGAAGLTASGAALGTLHYMAPEQLAGAAAVDHRSDLYAMGVILYELFTGNLPLGRFAPPSHHAGLDRRIDEVVLKSLEREPEKRWQSALDLQRAVEEVLTPAAATPQGPAAPTRREPRPRPAQERVEARDRQALAQRERALPRAGLVLVVLGALWLLSLIAEHGNLVVWWPDRAADGFLALAGWIAAPLALAGGIAVLVRCGLALAVLGALAAWVAVVQAGEAGWWPALLTTVPALLTTPLLRPRLLVRHFAGPWRWQTVLGMTMVALCALAVGVLAVVPTVRAVKRERAGMAQMEAQGMGARLAWSYGCLRDTLTQRPGVPVYAVEAIERIRAPLEQLVRWCGDAPPRDEDPAPTSDQVLMAVAAIQAQLPTISRAVANADTHWLRPLSSANQRLTVDLCILQADPSTPVQSLNRAWLQHAYEVVSWVGGGAGMPHASVLRSLLTSTTWLSAAQAGGLLARFRDPGERRAASELLRPYLVDPLRYDAVLAGVLPPVP